MSSRWRAAGKLTLPATGEGGNPILAEASSGMEQVADTMKIHVPKNPLQEYMFFYIASSAVLAIIFGAATLPAAISFYDHPRSVDAVVTGKDCPSHARIDLSYQINGIAYSSVGSSGDQCTNILLGSHIAVWVDVTKPSVTYPDTPSMHLKDALEGVPIGSLWMSIMVAAMCMRARRRSLVRVY